jgi:hypothetical protein
MPNDLDAQVHAQVMGLTWDASRCRICGWPLESEPFYCRPPADCRFSPRPMVWAVTPRPYSTNVQIAWVVVDHLHEHGYAVTIEYGRFDSMTDAPGYEVTFRRQGDVHASGPSSTGYAATVAEAICLAALEVARGDHP